MFRFNKLGKNTNGKRKCQKCGGEISKGEFYRSTGNGLYGDGNRYHLKCVGFIASRYSNVFIKNPTGTEIYWKQYYDTELWDKFSTTQLANQVGKSII